jgi:hypothetical protein
MSIPPQQPGTVRAAITGSLAETSTAISVLLSALDGLYPYVMQRDGESTVDGESHAAASVTVWGICSRIDAVLANTELWDCSQRQRIEKAAEALIIAQKDEALSRVQLSAILQRPSSRMQPKLTRYADGMWRASYGTGKHMLYGMGASPEKAIEAFDAAFAQVSASKEPTKEETDENRVG